MEMDTKIYVVKTAAGYTVYYLGRIYHASTLPALGDLVASLRAG